MRQVLGPCQKAKNLWNIKVTVIPVIIGVLGTVLEYLVRELDALEIGGQTEAIQATILLKSATILRRVLVSCERPLADADVKKLVCCKIKLIITSVVYAENKIK